jgi:hypothetical protein
VEIVLLLRSFLFMLMSSNFIHQSSCSQHATDWISADFYADNVL